MTLYQTLVDRGNIRSVATRPAGSDSWPPPPGTVVPWVLSQPVQDMLRMGRVLGWTNLGTIGNLDHLRKHGDHTPWSGGKVRGILYAKDTDHPSWFRDALLTLMRRPDYDTTWIDFVNIDNMQFGFAGNYLGYSPDGHLHVSVNEGFELLTVTLFYDAYRVHYGKDPLGGSVAFTKEDLRVLANTDGVIEAPPSALKENPDNKFWSLGSFLRSIRDHVFYARREATDAYTGLSERLDRVEAKVDTLAAGGPSATELVTEFRRQIGVPQ